MTILPVTSKHNNVVSPSKSTPHQKVQNANVQTTEKVKDSVDITTVAKEITKAFESSKTTAPINKERVDAVRKALAEGTYPINAEQIAKKMIEMEREHYNDSR